MHTFAVQNCARKCLDKPFRFVQESRSVPFAQAFAGVPAVIGFPRVGALRRGELRWCPGGLRLDLSLGRPWVLPASRRSSRGRSVDEPVATATSGMLTRVSRCSLKNTAKDGKRSDIIPPVL